LQQSPAPAHGAPFITQPPVPLDALLLAALLLPALPLLDEALVLLDVPALDEDAASPVVMELLAPPLPPCPPAPPLVAPLLAAPLLKKSFASTPQAARAHESAPARSGAKRGRRDVIVALIFSENEAGDKGQKPRSSLHLCTTAPGG
jgi:hypothetical protein